MGICRLCGEEKPLTIKGHIIPSFAYDWLKGTSGSGFLREGNQPNLRIQDGIKDYFYCESCEQLFSKYETMFAKQIFYPLIQNQGLHISYSDWMLKFCVSVSWRILDFFYQKGLSHLSETQLVCAENALNSWKFFLLGKEPNPGIFEQHFYPMGPIASASHKNELPININRYILRTIEKDVIRVNEDVFVYTKFGQFFLFGFVNINDARDWKEGKVHVKSGEIKPSNYKLPGYMQTIFINKANKMDSIENSISQTQKEKIQKIFTQDPDKVANSDSFHAMKHDVDLFGKRAFKDYENDK